MPGLREVRRDGRSWRAGASSDVAWINDATVIGRGITSAVPPGFDAYATVSIEVGDDERVASDASLLGLLDDATYDQPWWLGYLDTGAHDVVFADAARVRLYAGWPYVLIEAGPVQAGRWRADDPWRGCLPDLLFPADCSWLLSMLWDDDWRCIGGTRELIDAVLSHPDLTAHEVGVDDDATPPGLSPAP